MNKQLFLFFISIVISGRLWSQSNNISSFIPKDYDTLAVAKGDLNNDGVEDYILALNHQSEKKEGQNDDSIPPRLLIIVLRTAKGYIQAERSSNALLCKDCGGVFGDPFQGIEIKENVLNIYHYGGSAWRWSYTHKFRFQNNHWYLIGQTINSYWCVKHCDKLDDFAGTNNEDINFITGHYEVRKVSENCKLLINKKGKKKIQPLLALNKFSIEQ
ncbi:MAG: hypothetical protein ABIN97_00920 [Ginsengibacter sp.]